MRLSEHARRRCKERLKLKPRSLTRLLPRMVKYGIRSGDLPVGPLRAYMARIDEQFPNAIRIYYNRIHYVFDEVNKIVVTLYREKDFFVKDLQKYQDSKCCKNSTGGI